MTRRTLHICYWIIILLKTKSYHTKKYSLEIYIVKIVATLNQMLPIITKMITFFSEAREEIDEVSPDGRVTTFSTIKFRPTSSDNGVTWACEADHPALSNSPLRTTVLLSVLRKFIFVHTLLFMSFL